MTPEQREVANLQRRRHRKKVGSYALNVKWIKNNREKWLAHVVIAYHVRRGNIQKPDHCQCCGAQKEKHELQGHHPDYSKQREVVWVCQSCHSELDKLRRMQNGDRNTESGASPRPIQIRCEGCGRNVPETFHSWGGKTRQYSHCDSCRIKQKELAREKRKAKRAGGDDEGKA
jgi:hypothetical protein